MRVMRAVDPEYAKPGERAYVYYLLDGKEIVGYANASFDYKRKNSAYIFFITVGSGYRKHGYGTMLMNRILKDIDALHLPANLESDLELSERENPKNAWRVKWYKKFGFTPVSLGCHGSVYNMHRKRR